VSQDREAGRRIVGEMLGDAFADAMATRAASGGFGAGMAAGALDDCYGRLWADPRLDRRSRSLVTLGILIALRADGEIQNHVRAALANGISAVEIEALFEHAVAYVGYPAAGHAMAKAAEVLTGQGLDVSRGGANRPAED
jgi:4-carboxymuconolactone decarboxylase